MENAVTALTTTVTADSLWSVFADAIPFIGIVIVVAAGYWLLKRLLKGVSHFKAKV